LELFQIIYNFGKINIKLKNMGKFQTAITIQDAINKIDTNKYLIPAFQREFVWSQEQIENLFDSLMRGYPISSMLFWEVTGDSRKVYQYYQFLQEYIERHKIHNEPKAGCESMESFYAVLDGQQRLTSLFLGLKGTVAYHRKYQSWENEEKNFPPMKLYLNLSNTSEQDEGSKKFNFKFLGKTDNKWEDFRIEGKDKWYRIGAVLNINSITKYSREHSLNDEEAAVLEKLQNIICTEPTINYYLETDVEADKAVDIFVRINSGGRPLSISDILMSIVVAGWKENDARREFENLHELIAQKGFDISNDYIIKSLQYLLDKPVQSKISTFNGAFVEETELKWRVIKECILSVFNLLNTYGLTGSTLTSYNATMPILFYLFKKNVYDGFATKTAYIGERDVIKKWLLKTLLLKSFGGSSDSTLEQARRAFNSNFSNFPENEISKSIKQPTILDQEAIDEILSTQKDQTYAFAIMALFYPHLNLSNKFNLDHMHPQAQFDDYYKQLSNKEEKRDVWSRYNSIVNLQLLGENENKSKNDMSLEEWVKEIGKDRTTLEKETYLPSNIGLSVDNFDEFYKERKKLLTKKLLEVLGIKIAEVSTLTNDDSEDFNSDQAMEIVSTTPQMTSAEKYCIIKNGYRDDNQGAGYGKVAIAKEFFSLFIQGRILTGDIYEVANKLVSDEIHTSRAVFKSNPSKGKEVFKLDSGEEIILDLNIWGNNTDCWLKLRDYLTNENPYFKIELLTNTIMEKIKIDYKAPYTSFGPQTPKFSFSYDYLTGNYEYQYGQRELSHEEIEKVIHFINDKSNIIHFFNLPNIQEGFHDSQEFLTMEYDGKTKTISQNIMNRIYNHPFNFTRFNIRISL